MDRKKLNSFSKITNGTIQIAAALAVLGVFLFNISRNAAEKIKDDFFSELAYTAQTEASYTEAALESVITRAHDITAALEVNYSPASASAKALIEYYEKKFEVTDIYILTKGSKAVHASRETLQNEKKFEIPSDLSTPYFISQTVSYDGGTYFAAAVPINAKNSTSDILVIVCDVKKFSHLTGHRLFGSQGHAAVFQTDGNYVFKSDKHSALSNDNSFFFIRNAVFYSDRNFTVMSANLAERKSGALEFSYNSNEVWLSYYVPVNNTDSWYLAVFVPASYLDYSIKQSNYLLLVIMAVNFFVFLIVFAAISNNLSKWNKKLQTTVSKLMKNDRDLRLGVSQVVSYIFTYRTDTKEVTIINDSDKNRKPALIQKTMPLETWIAFVHESERETLLSELDRFTKEKKQLAKEVRLNSDTFQNTKYSWFKMILKPVSGEEGEPLYAVGTLDNIDDSKTLRDMASLDQLTGLLNRTECERLIAHQFAQTQHKKHYAFMMIDIDDFKNINDTKGHLYGDAAIKIIGQELKNTFRNTDIIGRFGGDEFVIFLNNIDTVDIVLFKCISMQKELEKKKIGDEYANLSISIGIVFNDEPASFTELCHDADLALYQAKSEGKRKYVIFNKKAFAEV